MSNRQQPRVRELVNKEGAGVAAPNTLDNDCVHESTRSPRKSQPAKALQVVGSPAPLILALRPKDAAKALGLGVRKLWEETQPRGPIPCVRLGKAVVYPVDQLRAWLAKECGEVSR
jgi:hypothetical protein